MAFVVAAAPSWIGLYFITQLHSPVFFRILKEPCNLVRQMERFLKFVGIYFTYPFEPIENV